MDDKEKTTGNDNQGLRSRARVLWNTNDPRRAFAGTGMRRESDEEPVTWCEHCGSLAIVNCELPNVDCYCEKCHSTNTREGMIWEWQAKWG
jgi:hypothetical protein